MYVSKELIAICIYIHLLLDSQVGSASEPFEGSSLGVSPES